jgi:ribosome-binding ATPase YchF (GTP1/OBG family)
MKIGLVGYAGSGKSTAFRWLTGVAPDPAKVQQGQVGAAKVPDERLKKIADKFQPKKLTYAEVQFVDTPGLNVDDRKDNPRCLATLRESNGIAVVIDGFSRTDFASQFSKFREELLFADLEVVSNRIPKVLGQLKKTKPAKEKEADEFELKTLERVVAAFEAGKLAKEMGITAEEEKVLRSFQLLTLKPDTALVNRGDSGFADALPADLLALCPTAVQAPIKLELELAELDEESRTAFMADLGFTTSYRDECIRGLFAATGRIVFFTVGHDECRTWPITAGTDAQNAAGAIHRDLSEKFVRAEVIGYDDFLACGYSEKDAKAKGLHRLEGKQYVVRDADVMNILASH